MSLVHTLVEGDVDKSVGDKKRHLSLQLSQKGFREGGHKVYGKKE